MPKLEQLENHVRDLYSSSPQHLGADCAEWRKWFYTNHVFVVAGNAKKLASLFHADPDVAGAGGMLHDIADATMQRANPRHKQETLAISENLLQSSGFSASEIEILISDAIPKHSCHGTDLPQTPEGKATAAGDALAHLQTDFYLYGTWAMGKRDKALGWTKKWALEKIERDYTIRTFLPEVKALCQTDYEALKLIFSK